MLIPLMLLSTILASASDKCFNKTTSCPLTVEEWKRRSVSYPCGEIGKKYTCLMTENNDLAETCVGLYNILPGIVGCPFIAQCLGSKVFIVTTNEHKGCPDNTPGCPKVSHRGYSLYEMYKFPACYGSIVTTTPTVTYIRMTETKQDSTSHEIDETNERPTDLSNSDVNVDVTSPGSGGEHTSITLILTILVIGFILSVVLVSFAIYVLRYRNSEGNQQQDVENVPLFHTEDRPALKDKLLEIYKEEIQRVAVPPLYTHGPNLSVDEIYATVILRQDLEVKHDGNRHGRKTKDERENLARKPKKIFYDDDKPRRFIFLLGGAARGKSVFCKRLLQYWCSVKKNEEPVKGGEEWGEIMDSFNYLFFVQLRHVDEARTSIAEMICEDVFRYYPGYKDSVRGILSNSHIRCLIIVDGLDEWKLLEEYSYKLSVKGIPDVGDIVNYTVFFTSRPWKLEQITSVLCKTDRIIEILGLDENEINTLIHNVLQNYYDMKVPSEEYNREHAMICNKFKNMRFSTIPQIPMLAITCIQMWHEKEVEFDIAGSMTAFYIALIERLFKTYERRRDSTGCKSKISNIRKYENLDKVNLLKIRRNVTANIHLLSKLGKIAYSDLVADETHLVFTRAELLDSLDNDELELGFKVGIISQSIMLSCTDDKRDSVHFFHKSVQEFLSAIYIWTEGKLESFIEELRTIDKIFEYENIILFLSGLAPSHGCFLSEKIKKVANEDSKIQRFRESCDYETRKRVDLLCKLQIDSFTEITSSESIEQLHNKNLQFHATDVYLDNPSNGIYVRKCEEMLRSCHYSIVSLFLRDVPVKGECGISDQSLEEILSNITTLNTLYLNGMNSNRKIQNISKHTLSLKWLLGLCYITITAEVVNQIVILLLSNIGLKGLGFWKVSCAGTDNKASTSEPASLACILNKLPNSQVRNISICYLETVEDRNALLNVLPFLRKVQNIQYNGTSDDDVKDHCYDTKIVQILTNLEHLNRFSLRSVTIAEGRSLILSQNMTKLERLYFKRISMSTNCWIGFLESLLNLNHSFEVFLSDIHNMTELKEILKDYPLFKVIEDDSDDDVLTFSRLIQ